MLWRANIRELPSSESVSQRKVSRHYRVPKNEANRAVIGKQRGNNFKRIFDSAQQQLRTKFGMEMVVLPAKEKITLKDKRG